MIETLHADKTANRRAVSRYTPFQPSPDRFLDHHADVAMPQDFLSRYILYHGDFTSELPFEEYPIMKLMKDRERFEGYRVGMYSVKDGSQILFDVTGEPLVDAKGEFLGGIVLFHDVTDYAQTITKYKVISERQFENICTYGVVDDHASEVLTTAAQATWYPS